MTPEQVTVVQASFRKLVPISEPAAALVYARLFELDPALRGLFRGDITEQGRKFMAMLAIAVGLLHRIDLLVPQLEELGARHRAAGIQDSYYEVFGTALLWTLERALGADYTPEVRQAWTETYHLLAEAMKSGAAAATAVPLPAPIAAVVVPA
jgi:hemoglobin-like flavoprotein